MGILNGSIWHAAEGFGQPVLTLLSWPWAPSYLVSTSTGAAAVSHIRDMIRFKIAYRQ